MTVDARHKCGQGKFFLLAREATGQGRNLSMAIGATARSRRTIVEGTQVLLLLLFGARCWWFVVGRLLFAGFCL